MHNTTVGENAAPRIGRPWTGATVLLDSETRCESGADKREFDEFLKQEWLG